MSLGRLVWRLMPLAVVGYTLRDGTASAKETAAECIDIAKKIEAYVELRGATRMLQADVAAGEPLPNDLPRYMREQMAAQDGSDPAIDPWGNTYRIERTSNKILLYSCGPDESCHTEDDPKATVDLRW